MLSVVRVCGLWVSAVDLFFVVIFDVTLMRIGTSALWADKGVCIVIKCWIVLPFWVIFAFEGINPIIFCQ